MTLTIPTDPTANHGGRRVSNPISQAIQRALGRSDIYFGRSLYMRRWRLIHNRWFGVRVHQIMRSDADRELHDHPFAFVSIILAGAYMEVRPYPKRVRWYGPGSIIFRRATDLHRLVIPEGRSAWTLVFRGPVRREWGFQTDDGWVPWHEFVTAKAGRGRQAGPFSAESSV